MIRDSASDCSCKTHIAQDCISRHIRRKYDVAVFALDAPVYGCRGDHGDGSWGGFVSWDLQEFVLFLIFFFYRRSLVSILMVKALILSN